MSWRYRVLYRSRIARPQKRAPRRVFRRKARGRRAEGARKVRGRHQSQNQGKGKTSSTRAESWPASPRRRGRPGSGGTPPRRCLAGAAPGRLGRRRARAAPGPRYPRKRPKLTHNGAHGVVVSHPLSMREALDSIPSVSLSFGGRNFVFARSVRRKKAFGLEFQVPLL